MIHDQESTTQESHVPVLQQLVLVGGILLLVFGAGYLPKVVGSLSTEPATANIAIERTEDYVVTTPADLPTVPKIDEVTVTGRSAFVWDSVTERALYQKNPDERLPLASVTKLMTALLVAELLPADTAITITPEAIAQDGAGGFTPGEVFTAIDLTDLMLISSSNDAAYALAAAAGELLDPSDPATAFVAAMNIRANELGLEQTSFRNPTGLDISETEAGAYGSARDMVFLLEYIMLHHPEILERTTKSAAAIYNQQGVYHAANNTNPDTYQIAGLRASKTGFTDLAGGNLVVALDASLNRLVVIAVLGSTYDDRFTDVATLSQAARVAVE